jgi:hypothetical protein
LIFNTKIKAERQKAIERFKLLLSKDKTIEIIEKRKNRSLSSNALYWLWMQCLSDDSGQDKEDYHDYFKDKYIGVSTKIVFGKTIIKEPTTTDKDDKYFSAYMKQVKHESYHKFNVVLPEPDDQGFNEFVNKYL